MILLSLMPMEMIAHGMLITKTLAAFTMTMTSLLPQLAVDVEEVLEAHQAQQAQALAKMTSL